jgi:hypothetical protein
MKLLFGALIGLILLSGSAQARDAFDAVKCGSDIPKALIGKAMPDGTAVKIEDAHKAIGLKDEGADEINDNLQMVAWTICGVSYDMLISNGGHIYDVLAFPPHARQTPEFSGTCQRNGKDIPGTIYAVLDNKNGFDPDPTHHSAAGPPLPAIAAWRIDETKRKFVAEPIAGLLCSRWGVFTVDGGP